MSSYASNGRSTPGANNASDKNGPEPGSHASTSAKSIHSLPTPHNSALPHSIANKMPTELLQQLYNDLAPRDFHAAQRTSHAWMHASLRTRLLVTMLKRGGWWSSAKKELPQDEMDSEMETLYAHTLSRFLSRECSLIPSSTSKETADGTGNEVAEGTSNDNADGTSNQLKSREPFEMVEAKHASFKDLAFHHLKMKPEPSAEFIFQTSVCGQFLLAALSTRVVVLEIRSHHAHALTTIVCPRPVLHMSMDGSARRHTFAAVLQGHMGLKCDLDFSQQAFQRTDLSVSELSLDEGYVPTFKGSINVGANHRVIRVPDTGNLDVDLHACDEHVRSPNSRLVLYDDVCKGGACSVAICPKNLGVAFGSSTGGLQLYWVNADDGRNMRRWFPTTMPSDFVYFLRDPPGADDTEDHVQLITSEAHPAERPSVCGPWYPPHYDAEGPDAWGLREKYERCCDHLCAVPLSDGVHHLFTDPETYNVFLGGKSPFAGPIKLLRRVRFVPPCDNMAPRYYAAAHDLTWGARVLVAYDNTLVLYSVPLDVLKVSYTSTNDDDEDDSYFDACFQELLVEGDESPYNDFMKWRSEAQPAAEGEAKELWSFTVPGLVLGTVDNVCSVAMLTSPLTAWAWSVDGTAKSWQLQASGAP